MEIPKEHQLVCNSCGKVLDMRNLGQVFSHGVGNGDGTYYCLPDEDELDIEYDGCQKVGVPLYYPKDKNKPISLN